MTDAPMERADRPAPGGPHDPDAPDRLEPIRSAGGGAGADDPTSDPDEAGPGPEGEDPMQGEAPSG